MGRKIICPFCRTSEHVSRTDNLPAAVHLYRYYCQVCDFYFNKNLFLEGRITQAMIALGYGMFGFKMAVNGKSIMICDGSHSFPEQGDAIRVILGAHIMRTGQGNFHKIKSWEFAE